ncbi:hypothetical protein [Sphingomonas paucimobilis]|nr:hypothetical protein [Sphingomonas paucimobilis]
MTTADNAGAAKAVFANGKSRLLLPVPVAGLDDWNARIARRKAA